MEICTGDKASAGLKCNIPGGGGGRKNLRFELSVVHNGRHEKRSQLHNRDTTTRQPATSSCLGKGQKVVSYTIDIGSLASEHSARPRLELKRQALGATLMK